MTDQEILNKWYIIQYNPKLKLVIAKEAINSRMGVVLWKDIDYNTNYTKEEAKLRLLEMLKN